MLKIEKLMYISLNQDLYVCVLSTIFKMFIFRFFAKIFVVQLSPYHFSNIHFFNLGKDSKIRPLKIHCTELCIDISIYTSERTLNSGYI